MSTPSVQESPEQGIVSRQAREEACMWQALVRYSLGSDGFTIKERFEIEMAMCYLRVKTVY